jgi:hypothetical protein
LRNVDVRLNDQNLNRHRNDGQQDEQCAWKGRLAHRHSRCALVCGFSSAMAVLNHPLLARLSSALRRRD